MIEIMLFKVCIIRHARGLENHEINAIKKYNAIKFLQLINHNLPNNLTPLVILPHSQHYCMSSMIRKMIHVKNFIGVGLFFFFKKAFFITATNIPSRIMEEQLL